MPTRDIDPQRSVSELIVASARGEATAFAELYDATSSRVHGLSLRVVRDPAQAEEVTQEVYLTAWREAGRFDPARGSGLAWLLTIGHRKAVDRVRSAEAGRRRDAADHRLGERVHADPELPGEAGSAHEVRAALASLSPVHRQAIELAYFDGCTHSEVSRALQIPLGTAKDRIRVGLLRLRDVLAQPESQPVAVRA